MCLWNGGSNRAFQFFSGAQAINIFPESQPVRRVPTLSRGIWARITRAPLDRVRLAQSGTGLLPKRQIARRDIYRIFLQWLPTDNVSQLAKSQ